MKNKIFLLLSLVFVALGLSAQSLVFHECGGGETVITLPADMHIEASSGVVTFSSGSKSVDIPLGSVLAVTFRGKKGDVNDDQTVDVADIATIIDIMAGKGGDTEPEEKVYTSCPDGNHPHIIDLGLPSGTKWACCNVGASKPEEYGTYYAWGETKTKEVYSWETYIHWDGSEETCHNIGSDIAGTKYDAATANWKAPWRMPTYEQCKELLDNCISEWTTQNDVNGRKFTGPNGGTIFLPAAGVRWHSDLNEAGWGGDYWSSTLYESYPSGACGLGFGWAGELYMGSYGRYGGLTVRPVR